MTAVETKQKKLFQNDKQKKLNDHEETRTLNLPIRSRTPYPLGHAANHKVFGLKTYCLTKLESHVQGIYQNMSVIQIIILSNGRNQKLLCLLHGFRLTKIIILINDRVQRS